MSVYEVLTVALIMVLAVAIAFLARHGFANGFRAYEITLLALAWALTRERRWRAALLGSMSPTATYLALRLPVLLYDIPGKKLLDLPNLS